MTLLTILQNILANKVLLVLSFGIVLLALSSAIYIFLPVYRLRKLLEIALQELEKERNTPAQPRQILMEAADNIARYDRLYLQRLPGKSRLVFCLEEFERAWRDNIIPNLSDHALSVVSPFDFFTQDQLLPVGFSRRFMRAIPGVLTTSGIFGTFVGVSGGLLELSLRLDPKAGDPDPQMISQGILELMNGMSTAFFTSVLGIGLALLWIWMDRRLSRRLDQLIHELSARLSSLFPCLGPNNVWRYFLQFSAAQSSSLQALGGNLSSSLDQTIATHLKPQADAMLRVVEKMADFTGDTQIKGMERLLERFGDLVGDRLRSQFDNLSKTIDDICLWQQSVKNNLDQILAQVQQLTERQDAMLSSASRAAELFQASLGDLSLIHDHLSASVARFESLSEKLESHTASAHQANEEISRTVGDLSALARENSKAVETQTNRIHELVQASSRQVEYLNTHLNTAMDKFTKDCREGLGLTFAEFDKHLADLTHALSGTVAETDETVQELLGKMEEMRTVTSHLVEAQNQFKDTATAIVGYNEGFSENLRSLNEMLQSIYSSRPDGNGSDSAASDS